jgi:hypothetical protein
MIQHIEHHVLQIMVPNAVWQNLANLQSADFVFDP